MGDEWCVGVGICFYCFVGGVVVVFFFVVVKVNVGFG